MRFASARRDGNGSSCLLAALAAALFIGFLIPRPNFMHLMMDESFQSGMDDGSDDNSSLSPIEVDFYGESLCPDCRDMVLSILTPMFENSIADFMTLRYIAYGNVKGSVDDDDGISCQHGPAECLYNRYINCAQEKNSDQNSWFPLIQCMATHMRELDSRAADCAESAGFSAIELRQCAEGSMGAKLEREAEKETRALKPSHTFVPWIVVNGTPLGGDYKNLDRVVCSHIPKKKRPAACSELPRGLNSMG